nr:PREDICTED: uncharacterized protein LOC102363013 isoform X1 [Latimeria chalumnae]|eukprot:XP_014341098.1 PREDICTED: uncharacterized protein LOC102363013 isoform X1 [Latimeria chalumnae]
MEKALLVEKPDIKKKSSKYSKGPSDYVDPKTQCIQDMLDFSTRKDLDQRICNSSNQETKSLVITGAHKNQGTKETKGTYTNKCVVTRQPNASPQVVPSQQKPVALDTQVSDILHHENLQFHQGHFLPLSSRCKVSDLSTETIVPSNTRPEEMSLQLNSMSTQQTTDRNKNNHNSKVCLVSQPKLKKIVTNNKPGTQCDAEDHAEISSTQFRVIHLDTDQWYHSQPGGYTTNMMNVEEVTSSSGNTASQHHARDRNNHDRNVVYTIQQEFTSPDSQRIIGRKGGMSPNSEIMPVNGNQPVSTLSTKNCNSADDEHLHCNQLSHTQSIQQSSDQDKWPTACLEPYPSTDCNVGKLCSSTGSPPHTVTSTREILSQQLATTNPKDSSLKDVSMPTPQSVSQHSNETSKKQLLNDAVEVEGSGLNSQPATAGSKEGSQSKSVLRKFFSAVGQNTVNKLGRFRSSSLEQINTQTGNDCSPVGPESPRSSSRSPASMKKTPSFQSLRLVSPLFQLKKASSVQSLHSPKKKQDRSSLYLVGETKGLMAANRKVGSRPLHSLSVEDVGSPNFMRTVGRVVEAYPDGTFLLELSRPLHGNFGFYICLENGRADKGVYVQKMGDCNMEKLYAGLLAAGDEILEVNGSKVGGLSLEVVNNLMLQGNTLSLRVLRQSSRAKP